MTIRIITNNPLVHKNMASEYSVMYHEVDYIGLLKKVRDYIHLGHKLLTHPLSGSIKPNETPYKTVAITCEKGDLDLAALNIIENSVDTAHKFLVHSKTPEWPEKISEDFQLIDYTLIKEALIKTG